MIYEEKISKPNGQCGSMYISSLTQHVIFTTPHPPFQNSEGCSYIALILYTPGQTLPSVRNRNIDMDSKPDKVASSASDSLYIFSRYFYRDVIYVEWPMNLAFSQVHNHLNPNLDVRRNMQIQVSFKLAVFPC